ncbi:hypothetical protein VNO78_22964 [Psophocarpus tetragonolobus]|uniref:Uncharacterized protein n=1 Tax=Psophocarpus tetragonolobus TaxID=3891 RepID=A0AAN9S2W7_PSOTE
MGKSFASVLGGQKEPNQNNGYVDVGKRANAKMTLVYTAPAETVARVQKACVGEDTDDNTSLKAKASNEKKRKGSYSVIPWQTLTERKCGVEWGECSLMHIGIWLIDCIMVHLIKLEYYADSILNLVRRWNMVCLRLLLASSVASFSLLEL